MKKILITLALIASASFADTHLRTFSIKTDKGTTVTIDAYGKMLNSNTGIMTWRVSESNGDKGTMKFKCPDMDIQDMKDAVEHTGEGNANGCRVIQVIQ